MINIIPQPQILVYKFDNYFQLKEYNRLLIMLESEDDRLFNLGKRSFQDMELNYLINEDYKGFLLTINHDCIFTPDEKTIAKISSKKEAYYLKAEGDSVIIYSQYAAGLFYGIRTLMQITVNGKKIPSFEIIDWPDMAMRCMYFDLRQIFSKFENLLKYIEDFADYKVNTLIIEYEDKLPFSRFKELRHKELAFTNQQINMIKETARMNFIEIIPLQQTFGHLEYVLKHDEYKHLRETYEDIGELCPSKPESFDLVSGLLSEMLDMHKDSRFIHIGCDEVWSIYKCESCRKTYRDQKEAFIHFVNRLIKFVAGKGKTPIIWHDMISQFNDEELVQLDKQAVVMIWMYGGGNIEKSIKEMVNRLRRNGFNVVGASAVRCQDGKSDQSYPKPMDRIRNITHWVNAARELNLDAIVSTNWATAFSMGCPYGIFETTWYLNAYSAEKYWNWGADDKNFLQRFLCIFHGVDIEKISSQLEDCYIDQYYTIIGSISGEVRRNANVARLIGIANEYECLINSTFSPDKYYFRLMMFADDITERTSILAKYKKSNEILSQKRNDMESILREFIYEEFVQLFMNSRFIIYDFLEENLYKKLLKIL